MRAPGSDGEKPPVDRGLLFESPLVTVRDNRCRRKRSGLSPPTRPLPFHEVCLPRSGVWVRHLEGRALAVTPGTAHFLNRGETHGVSHPGECGDRNTGLALEAGALRELVGERDESVSDRAEPFAFTDAGASDEVHFLHRLLLRHLTECPQPEPVLVEELVLRVVDGALRCALRRPKRAVPRGTSSPRGAAARHRELAQRVRIHLGRHWRGPVRLQEVAAAVGSSPHHLCRVVHAETGATIHAHLLRLRLAGALELVAAGEPLADVAEATGFADRTHLSRRFRAAFGVSPSAFRARATAARVRDLLGDTTG